MYNVHIIFVKSSAMLLIERLHTNFSTQFSGGFKTCFIFIQNLFRFLIIQFYRRILIFHFFSCTSPRVPPSRMSLEQSYKLWLDLPGTLLVFLHTRTPCTRENVWHIWTFYTVSSVGWFTFYLVFLWRHLTALSLHFTSLQTVLREGLVSLFPNYEHSHRTFCFVWPQLPFINPS